jgi:hypothetical protein
MRDFITEHPHEWKPVRFWGTSMNQRAECVIEFFLRFIVGSNDNSTRQEWFS